MGLLAVIFVTTLLLTGGTYLLTQRTLESRDAAKKSWSTCAIAWEFVLGKRHPTAS